MSILQTNNCKRCADAVEQLLPKVSAAHRFTLLFEATCYPMGDCEDVIAQVKRLSERTDGTLEGCLSFAAEELDRQMEERVSE